MPLINNIQIAIKAAQEKLNSLNAEIASLKQERDKELNNIKSQRQGAFVVENNKIVKSEKLEDIQKTITIESENLKKARESFHENVQKNNEHLKNIQKQAESLEVSCHQLQVEKGEYEKLKLYKQDLMERIDSIRQDLYNIEKQKKELETSLVMREKYIQEAEAHIKYQEEKMDEKNRQLINYEKSLKKREQLL